MSTPVRAPRQLVEMKPKHGEPCNRCGLCCWTGLCDLAQWTFRRPESPGPCPALLGAPGTASCGMIDDPAAFVPQLVLVYGLEATVAAAKTLINAGEGCDMRIDGERNEAYEAEQGRKDGLKREEIDRAQRLWVGEL